MEAIDRFSSKYRINESTGCWEWTASTYGGYGIFKHENGNKAHRFSYEHYHQTILGELCIDHLCKNKICVNPEHLEAVTRRENSRRRNLFEYEYKTKEYCKNGHRIADNYYERKDGYRECRICRTNRTISHRAKDIDGHKKYMRNYHARRALRTQCDKSHITRA